MLVVTLAGFTPRAGHGVCEKPGKRKGCKNNINVLQYFNAASQAPDEGDQHGTTLARNAAAAINGSCH